MQKLLREYLDELNKRQKKNRRTGIAVLVLVVIVFGSVMGILTQYGVAMTGNPQCGLEEHMHTEECYEKTLACGEEEAEGHTHTDACLYPSELTCGQEEAEAHIHTDACLYPPELTCGQEETEEHAHTDACYTTAEGYACGKEETEGHTHTDACYTTAEGYACGEEEAEGHAHTDACYEETLICGKEEHIHTDICYIDANADVEDSAAWDNQYAGTEWTGYWGEDLAAAAQIQIGYQESVNNYVITEDGSHKGYTRYGHFAGDMYADWDASFVNFCMHYAGLEESGIFPAETMTAEWYEKFVAADGGKYSAYMAAPENYTPAAGDLVFFQKENEETTDQIGIVSDVDETNRIVKAIEGNNVNTVKETEYSLDDGSSRIVGYLKITDLQAYYQELQKASENAADPAAAESWAYEESFETGNVIIHVKAKESVVPEGAVLSVTPIEKTEITEEMSAEEAAEAEEINEQYELTNQKLQEESEKKEEVLQGFLAYDICFLADGQETEPNGEVNVTMEFKEAVKPEGVSEDAAVTVTHLKEDESAEDGIVLEDLTEQEAATVVTAEENASVEKVELVTESFSTFVIQWVGYEWLNIPIQYVDTDCNAIEGISEKTHQLHADGSETSLKSILPSIISDGEKNYEIVRFEIYTPNVPPEYEETYVVTGISGTWDNNQGHIALVFYTPSGDQISKYTSNNFGLYGDMAVRAVLTEKAGAAVMITDDVINSGAIKAEIRGLENVEEKDIHYIWYKKTGVDGEFLEVPLKQYEENMANLSADGKSLYIALDQGALNATRTSVQYQVRVYKNETDELIAESEPYDVTYYDNIQNGSFETPIVPAASYEQVTVEGTQDLFWKSTSTLQGATANDTTDIQAVEIARVKIETGDDGKSFGKIDASYAAGDSFFAADGNQFAELNANTAGTLYQDVLTIPGKTLTYQFSHRGRRNSNSGGYDNMYLVILPTHLAETLGENGGSIDTQSEIEDLIKKAIGGNLDFSKFNNDTDSAKFASAYPGGYIKKFTANPNSWTINSDNYTPADSLTRFFFISAETKPMQGNFLDNISFSQQILRPGNDKVSLRIEKTVQGLEVSGLGELADKLAELEFNVEVKGEKSNKILYDGKVGGTDSENKINWEFSDEAGVYTGYFNIPEISTEVGQTCIVSVTESGGSVSGYTLEVGSSNTVSKAIENKECQTVEVDAGQSVAVSFTNTYTPQQVEPPHPDPEWKMIKCSTSKNTETDKPLETPPGAEFNVADKKGSIVATGVSGTGGVIAWTTKSDQEESSQPWKPMAGAFTITETKAPAGYAIGGPWEVTFTDGVPTVQGITSEPSEDGSTVIYLENTPVYTLPSTGGSGICWYMFSGVLLMAGAALFLYKIKVQGGAGESG